MKRLAVCVAAVCGLALASAYAAEVKLDGVKCIMNPKADAKAERSVSYKEGKVYFCCENCPKAFEKETKKFAAKANSQLVATGQAKQGKCPFSGHDLDDAKQLTVNGAKIKFCCDDCLAKAEKETGDKQIDLVFNDDAWKMAEFKVEKAK